MAQNYYAAQVLVAEGNKHVKDTLTIFSDEYVFRNSRRSVDWSVVVLRKGMATVKSFLKSSTKPSLVFAEEGFCSPEFIFEQDEYDKVLALISGYVKEIEHERQKREEERLRAEKEDRERALAEEAARLRAHEEENARLEAQRLAKEAEERKAAAIEHAKKIEHEQKVAERTKRIQTVVSQAENASVDIVSVSPKAQHSASLFLDNPYRILGISCLATKSEANSVLDKLKKLARLNAISSFATGYELRGIEKPCREISVVQNALSALNDPTYKFFWFSGHDACVAWTVGKYRMELIRDGVEYGTYDLFIANYLYAIVCDSDFDMPETWKRVLNYYCYVCENPAIVLSDRFEGTSMGGSGHALATSFRGEIFKPLFALANSSEIPELIKLHKIISSCENKHLNNLQRRVLESISNWFSEEKRKALAFLAPIEEVDSIASALCDESAEYGFDYCRKVEPYLRIVLSELRDEPVRCDMIKESYRHVTYQYMYELNKCSNKTNAVLFANRCYPYCDDDARQRIKNTFGAINIKADDGSAAHVSWDIMADGYYNGSQGYEQDYSKAVYWYRKAADEGNSHSMNSMGICYQNGHGVAQSDEQAANWFERAYDAGNPNGAYNLAECFFSGKGRRKDTDRALTLWQEAAKLGHSSARERRAGIFGAVKAERKALRRRNHICIDLGFQMPVGSSLSAAITLNRPGYAYLVDDNGYRNYLEGDQFSFRGGYTSSTYCEIGIPTTKHWYVVIDNGESELNGLTGSAKVIK